MHASAPKWCILIKQELPAADAADSMLVLFVPFLSHQQPLPLASTPAQ